MSDTSALPGSSNSLPPLTSLVKPEQVLKLTHFEERARTQCYLGVKKLWEAIQTHPTESNDYHNAYKKLIEVTKNIHAHVKKQRDEHLARANNAQASRNQITQETQSTDAVAQAPQAAQQNGSAPSNQGQKGSLPTPAPPSQGVEHFSPKVLQIVQSQSFIVPPHISQQGLEHSQIWMREARLKYDRYLQKHEIAKAGLFEMTKADNDRQQEGRSFNE